MESQFQLRQIVFSTSNQTELTFTKWRRSSPAGWVFVSLAVSGPQLQDGRHGRRRGRHWRRRRLLKPAAVVGGTFGERPVSVRPRGRVGHGGVGRQAVVVCRETGARSWGATRRRAAAEILFVWNTSHRCWWQHTSRCTCQNSRHLRRKGREMADGTKEEDVKTQLSSEEEK